MMSMTAQEKMALVMSIYNSIFTSKANGMDIVTVEVFHKNIVNGKPILDNNVRVGGCVNGRWFKDSSTGQSTLRGFDIDIQADGKILQLRFIEQNPNKMDNNGNLKPMANQARRGSKIMWIIDRKIQGFDAFLGNVQDGTFHPSQNKAVQPAAKPGPVPSRQQPAPVYQAQSASQEPEDEVVEEPLWEEGSVPDLSEDLGIPEQVMKYYEEMEPGDEADFTEL